MHRIADAFIVLVSLVTFTVALFSLRAAGAFGPVGFVHFLPAALALAGTTAVVAGIARGKTWPATIILLATIWATIVSLQLTLTPSFARYLPTTRLAAAVPVESVLYVSREASGWRNCFINLPSRHRVERLIGDDNNEKLLTVLRNDPKAVAVVSDREYHQLAKKNPDLRLLAAGPTFGRGGLTWKKISEPRLEVLLLIGQGH